MSAKAEQKAAIKAKMTAAKEVLRDQIAKSMYTQGDTVYCMVNMRNDGSDDYHDFITNETIKMLREADLAVERINPVFHKSVDNKNCVPSPYPPNPNRDQHQPTSLVGSAEPSVVFMTDGIAGDDYDSHVLSRSIGRAMEESTRLAERVWSAPK